MAASGDRQRTHHEVLPGAEASSAGRAQLIGRLADSQQELARRVEQEAILRAITARIAVLQEPAEVLQRIVDESRRLLGADGAHLTLMSDAGDFLVPAVLADTTDAATTAWLAAMAFPLGGGINGLAASEGHVVWTPDYLNDARIPQDPADRDTAIRMGLGSMVAAPLRGSRDIIGTLAISYREPRDVPLHDRDLLQALADIAAIAVANSRLYQELHDSERRYHYLLSNSPDIVWQTDRDGRLTFLSDVFERAVGDPVAGYLGAPFESLVHPDSGILPHEVYHRLATPPFPAQTTRFFLRGPEGLPVPAELRAVADVRDGAFGGAHGIVRDLRDQVRLEDDLRRQAADLGSAQERARLAQELHDSVTQALFSMTLTTRSVELLLDRDPAAARQMLGELRELEREALAEMRALIFELRPANLEHDGLVQAIRTHAAGIQGRVGLSVRVECAVPDDRAPLEVETALYRITQEALHNVVKHADANAVTILLTGSAEEGLRLTVQDDGAGFDPVAIPAGHLGIAGMRARASQIGATIEVVSAAGAGTRVEVLVPAERLAVGT